MKFYEEHTMKNVVVYRSKYGTTKKYAEWISEFLSCDIYESRQIDAGKLASYDNIIYGGALYAGGVIGIDILKKNYDSICEKNIIVFTCGLGDPKEKENTNNIRQSLSKVLTKEMQEGIKVFHLRGGIDYSKLNFAHRSMMSMMNRMLKKKDPEKLNDEEKQMLDTYGEKVDFTDKNSIQPIIDHIKELDL